MKPQFTPITLNDTDFAKLYTHLHPIIVLSIYLVSFKLVVADPVSSLASLLVPLAALQAVYVVVCLPPTGSHDIPGGKLGGSGSKKTGKGKAKKPDVTLGMKIIVWFPPKRFIQRRDMLTNTPTASTNLAPPHPNTRNTNPFLPLHSSRRSSNNPYTSYSASRCASRASNRNTDNLYTRH